MISHRCFGLGLVEDFHLVEESGGLRLDYSRVK